MLRKILALAVLFTILLLPAMADTPASVPTPVKTDAQVQAFVTRNSEARTLAAPGHLIPGKADKAGMLADNALGDHDGFFYALLQKTR